MKQGQGRKALKRTTVLKLGLVVLVLCLSGLALILAWREGDSLEKKNPKEEPKVLGVLVVKPGDQLERDLIPQLVRIYGVSLEEVKETLRATGNSPLINPVLMDFRRLEGQISPGSYPIHEGTTLEAQTLEWIKETEVRFQRLKGKTPKVNSLLPFEQLVLGSMVEAECLGDRYHSETATVFLNRLREGAKLQSCVTVEYALGLQRPYLLFVDLEVNNPYNTYQNTGLPPGPLCAIGEESLSAAIVDQPRNDLRYFYYDYVLGDMFFFEEYAAFQREGVLAGERFKKNSTVERHSLVNKQVQY